MRKSVREIFIDLSGLGAEEKQGWLSLLDLALQALGLQPSIVHFSGQPKDDVGDFAYIADSAGFSRKLLLHVPRLWIQPRHGPRRVDVFWYFCALKKGILSECKPTLPPVSLISSVFRADEYIEAFLQNMAALHGYAEYEHWLIRPASPGCEHERLIRHVQEHAGAVYVNLASDPGLYAVWNLGVQLATGRFLTNANLDDRRAPEQLLHLQKALMEHPEAMLSSTPLRITEQKNLPWDASEICPVWFADVGDQLYGVDSLFRKTPQGLASRNLPHCMPLWRRSLHAFYGDFDEKRYGPSADWAFWLRVGQQGARFHIGGPALGLYLRDAGTYWRRSSQGGEFDARIVAEFADDAGDLAAGRPESLEIATALDCLRAGAMLDGMGRLLQAAAKDNELSNSSCAVLDQACHKFFDGADSLGWLRRFKECMRLTTPPDVALFNALVDLLHGVTVRTSDTVLRHLALACIDWMECFADGRGAIALALLAGRSGDKCAERQLLQHQHAADMQGFWSSVQSVYRFTRPLPELCSMLPSLKTDWNPGKSIARHQVFYYPAFTNAYQALLYQPLLAAGGKAHGNLAIDEFLANEPRPGFENIFHIHWINHFFANPDLSTAQIEINAAQFFEALKKKQKAGCQIFWTIHNHLSHESVNPNVEIAFRKRLYQLADRVFVHHPLAVSLLDWLPDHDKLWLCEHGAYDMTIPAALSRQAARHALGFGDDEWVVTHVGQVRNYKGLDRALPLLYDMLQTIPRMRLVIAGRIKSAEVKDWLANHPHPRLTVEVGFISEERLVQHMRAADLGILSYNAILTSGSLVHWLSCGRLVLAPSIGTVPAYLVDGWNGFLFSDDKSLKQRLTIAAQLSADSLSRMEANAQATAQQLSWRMWQ